MLTMTLDARQLVQDSWDLVLPHAGGAADAFYDRLVDVDPQLGRLFRGRDMREQGRALVRAVTAMVRAWEPPAFHPSSDPWESAHLTVIASALFAMLERGMGPCLTATIRGAWLQFFAGHAAALRAAALGGADTSRVVPIHHGRAETGEPRPA